MKKTHKKMIDDYQRDAVIYKTVSKTPQKWFVNIANEFQHWIDSTADLQTRTEAKWGLQETLNEYMAGQSLIGNDNLIKGLRVRFPGQGDPADPDQLTLLSWAEDKLAQGIDRAVEVLRKKPAVMRSGGDPPFYIFVRNSIKSQAGSAPIVENEIYRFTNLVDRYGMASNSKGKRMFFFGNVKDVDNFPYHNFPATEDLDLNRDGIKNDAGRTEASDQIKKSAHAIYLHVAILAAVQSKEQFHRNGGYKLKRQINDAERVFDDIKRGFNPLKLQGDFLPYQPVENFLSLARARINDAIAAENAAKNAERTYDLDKTALRSTLESQQLNYINRIEQIAGLTPNNYDLKKPDEVHKLLRDAKENAKNGAGELGLQQLAIEETLLAAKQQELALKQIPERIRIEQERHKAYAFLVKSGGKRFAVLSYVQGIANSVRVFIGMNSGIEIHPNAALSGFLQGQRDILQATQQADIDGIQSQATIKQLLLEQAMIYLSLERARKVVERERARYRELLVELTRSIANYQTARADFTDAYFNNPAYRLDHDQLAEAAETTFETAMTECYYAAKALEYLWSEKFNNPVMRLDGGLPEALSASFDPFVRAESVFAVHFASLKSPGLDDFLDGLQAWDLKMRQLRMPNGQSGTRPLSMRRDILGFDGADEERNLLLFKNFIEKHRVKGQNVDNDNLQFQFTVEIGDQKLLPAHPNLKLAHIAMNLVSNVTGSIRGAQGVQPVLVDLVQLDQAHVRSFFSEYPKDDDILVYYLERGRSLDKSPFKATVESFVDNYAYPLPQPNVQLKGHSPAITRWGLRIDTNIGQNRHLRLEHLEDIELTFAYTYGKPREVRFVP